MKARIHRGAHEIGGSCVELESGGRRLVLDLGLPLSTNRNERVPLPPVAGIESGGDSSLLGVVVSHGHPDHYGLLDQIGSGVPIIMGRTSEAILKEAAYFGAAPELPPMGGHLRHRVPIELGPFLITPVLVDHSAFDSYALLVEADSRRLFYSGDLRAHGRKAGTFRQLLDYPPKDVDAMLLEGTSLGRPRAPTDIEHEDGVERAAIEVMRRASGLVLAMYSPQNIDRLVSIYKATLRIRPGSGHRPLRSGGC